MKDDTEKIMILIKSIEGYTIVSQVIKDGSSLWIYFIFEVMPTVLYPLKSLHLYVGCSASECYLILCHRNVKTYSDERL
jgi:hypothetical protein